MARSHLGLGVTVCDSSADLPSSPTIGQIVFRTDTDETLKYVTYAGANRWMQVGARAGRNVLINGDMSVAQRNTGSVALTNAYVYATVDRWVAAQIGTANGTVAQQSSNLPTGFFRGVRIGRNNGATTTGALSILQALETRDSVPLQGKYVTVSFWARAGTNMSGGSTMNISLVSGTGNDQPANSVGSWTGYSVVISQAQAITASWGFYSVSGLVPSNSTQLALNLNYFPSGTAGADDNMYITGVQLEAGTAPSEFDYEPYQETLRKCMRYYENASGGVSWPSTAWLEACSNHAQPMSTTACAIQVRFLVPKRVTPNVTNHSYNGTANAFSLWNDASDRNAGSISYSRINATGMGVLNNSAGTFITNNFVWLGWVASAEL